MNSPGSVKKIIQPAGCFFLAVLICTGKTVAQDSPGNAIYPVYKLHPLFRDAINLVHTDISRQPTFLLFEAQPDIHLNLPTYTKHHLFKKPVVAHDFNLAIYPDFRPKFKYTFIDRFKLFPVEK